LARDTEQRAIPEFSRPFAQSASPESQPTWAWWRTILTYDADYRKYAASEIVEICLEQSEERLLV
jgi:hypothetical protein